MKKSTNFVLRKQLSYEETLKVIKVFEKWESSHLEITYGKKEKEIEYTYGLPYVSSGSYAQLGNTNCIAVLKGSKHYMFDHLAVDIENSVIAVCDNKEEKEKLLVIGKL